MEILIPQINNTYGLEIRNYAPAPRGFCAETYYLSTDKGRFFVKIFNNPRFAENLAQSLRQQAQLAASLPFIPQPIPTRAGQYMFPAQDGRIVSLYQCIEGTGYRIEHCAEAAALMAKIYLRGVTSPLRETFPLCLEKQYDDLHNWKRDLSPETARCIYDKTDFINTHWDSYRRLCQRLQDTHTCFYLTHGDMPGNLMRDSEGTVYLIDWDDIRMAPIERDFWTYLTSGEEVQTLTSTLRHQGIDWRFTPDYHAYYVYTRFFEDLYDYAELDMLGKESGPSLAGKIQSEVFDWLFPLMEQLP